ncbi:PREDICTED: F-box/LRR-repeat protein At3g48880-like [Fragaria vesca subsp. vesca]
MLRPETEMKLSSDLSSPPRINGVVSNQDADQSLSRKWEELEVDCLATVFAKVGMESLVLALPFVCKSWYATTQNPLCWKFLSFPEFQPYPLFSTVHNDDDEIQSFGPFYDKFVEEFQIDRTRFSITGFIKLIVNHSKGKAVELKLPPFCTEEALRYVADACPGIRCMHFADDLELFKHSQILPEVIVKWKFLEDLTLGGNMDNISRQLDLMVEQRLCGYFEAALLPYDNFGNMVTKNLGEILVQIGIHCKSLRSLHVFDTIIVVEHASTLVTMLPNLVDLTLEQCRIGHYSLVTLLRGCKKLWRFKVWNTYGFEEGHEGIRNLASHISEFKCKHDQTGHISFNLDLKEKILERRSIHICRKANSN